MAAVPNNRRLSPRTGLHQQSIWRDTGEDAFRRNVVRLARASNGVAWSTDVVTRTTRPIASSATVPRWGGRHSSEHRLPLAIERRLSDDFAFIAAVQEGVHSVTATCIEESSDERNTGTDMRLTLRMAANGGIPDNVRSTLEDIWKTVQTGAGLACRKSNAVRDTIFAKIIRLNGARILQRISIALGRPPAFLSSRGAVLTASTGGLDRSIRSIQQTNQLTAFGRTFSLALATLEQEFCDISASWTPDDAAQSPDDGMVERLQAVSKQAFLLTTTGQNASGMLFNHVLEQAGLEVRRWLENKALAEVDKIGSYWRVAKTLASLYREILRTSAITKVELEVTTLVPYRPVQSGISTKVSPRKPQVECYVHAEIQLLCHYLLAQPTINHGLPRVMGTSKLSCFLCFLCISCHGGFEPPLPHGQVFDQWTIPDLAQYDNEAVTALRQTIALMDITIKRMSKKQHVRKPFPLTSRVHIDELPVSSVEGSHSYSPRRTELSESSHATNTGNSTGGAVGAVPELVPNEWSVLSSSAPSSSDTRSSWSDGQSVAVTLAPYRWTFPQVSDIELLVEAEPPCTGQARLEYLEWPKAKPEATASIVVDELLPGKDYVFSRTIDQPQIVIDFKLADGSGLHRLKMKWDDPQEGCHSPSDTASPFAHGMLGK